MAAIVTRKDNGCGNGLYCLDFDETIETFFNDSSHPVYFNGIKVDAGGTLQTEESNGVRCIWNGEELIPY